MTPRPAPTRVDPSPFAVSLMARAPWLSADTGALIVLTTPAPVFAAYAMPDTFGVIAAAYPLDILPTERSDAAGRAAPGLLAAFALLTHDDDLPVHLAVGAAAVGLFALVAALAVNALVFGGRSAPGGPHQARLGQRR